MKYTCIDSFSGAGGLALGFREVGFEIRLSFDNDPRCIETQKMNGKYLGHPAILASIEEMENGRLLEITGLAKGDLFLFAGGPPCQGFSIQRIGSDEDPRNNLVSKFIGLVDELQPKYFLMENVAGIVGKRGKHVFQDALNKAASIGYWTHVAILDAQDYGVPQRRRRVVVVGERNDGTPSVFRFPAPTTPEGCRVTVRRAIGHLPPPPVDGTDHPEIPHHRKDRLSATNLKRIKALKQGQGRTSLPDELLADCHRRDASEIGHRNVYGRMSWNEVSPTITARFDSFTRGLFGHPEQLRSITLREGALLQTFPPDFVFSGNKVDVARQIGNAVPRLFAKAIGRQIIRCHQAKVEKRRAG